MYHTAWMPKAQRKSSRPEGFFSSEKKNFVLRRNLSEFPTSNLQLGWAAANWRLTFLIYRNYTSPQILAIYWFEVLPTQSLKIESCLLFQRACIMCFLKPCLQTYRSMVPFWKCGPSFICSFSSNLKLNQRLKLRALQIALHLSATWLVLDFVNICCLCVAVAFVQTHTCITQCPLWWRPTYNPHTNGIAIFW